MGCFWSILEMRWLQSPYAQIPEESYQTSYDENRETRELSSSSCIQRRVTKNERVILDSIMSQGFACL
jgi:hypothetical protein